jgi:hypothetical protein
MNKDLLSNNYLVVKNFIEKDRAIKLSKEFKLCDSFFNFSGDPQAPNSSAVYNYLPALEILCEKTAEVSNIIGETVLPTYTYSRIYRNGSVLNKHTDRSSCEISLTLHLDGDKPWSIWVENPQGKPRCVTLNPGDALVYLGCVAPHWRDEYVGKEYTQIFLHYVRSRGSFADCYFDKSKKNHSINDIIKEYTEMGWITQEKINSGIVQEKSSYSLNVKKDIPYSIKVNNKPTVENHTVKINTGFKILGDSGSPFNINEKFLNETSSKTSDKSLKSYIKVFDNCISDDLSNLILDEYENDPEWHHTLTGSGHDPSARNCSAIPMSQDYVIAKNESVRKQIDQDLYEVVSNALKEYEKEIPEFELEIKEDSGYELLRYNAGEFYVEHTDSFKEMPRALTCIIALNDDYDGGEISFFKRELTYKLKKGSIIMFPSSFMYPHEIQTITKGTRYSIITWLV